MKYKIVSITKLRPLEKVFPTHLKNLEQMIDDDGFLLKPLIVDMDDGIVLDGSHRYAYLLKKGFKEAPVYWVSYSDENVRVGKHLSHRFLIQDSSNISKEGCRQRALSGNLFPPRTTRHFFTFRKSDISLSLDSLQRGNQVDISHLLEDVEIVDEIQHNKRYIKEINEEIDIIIEYLWEVMQTKEYLTNQIELMDECKYVAFFPGKFHPPHIGHIQTILNILHRYKKLIIGVSEHMPEKVILTPDEIQKSLNSFFKDFDNVEICRIDGTLVEKENLEGLPKFDVLLSGNDDVLKWAKTHGLKTKYTPRSKGYLYSGTEIRTAFTEREV